MAVIKSKEELMMRLRQHNDSVISKASADEKAVYSRQRDEDLYKDLYENGLVIKPPYDFSFLRSLYEESDVLQSCVSAMVKNIVGMGYTFVYLGEDTLSIPPEAGAEQEKLLSFFSEVNDTESWTDVLTNVWEDYEVMGCGAIEAIRNFSNELMFLYYHPVENLRKVAAADNDYVDVDVKIKREGRVVTSRANVFFRRYVARLANGSLRFYKSFGDPRPLRIDGTYNSNALLASELLWIENKKGVLRYGLPRWIGSTFDVAGRRDAQVLNWDALRSQGISPMAILVNGRLSEDSWDEIYNMIMGSKGVENFNKIWVLQVAATPTAVGASSSADVKIQDLSSAQKTDEMFANYLKGTEERIRQSFRIPAGFLGGTGAYSYGTLKVAKLLGEEQVFGPERHILDNKINRLLLRNGFNVWNWRYKTKAAEVAGPEEIRQAISSMVSSGAISINNAVKLASDALGREFSQFPEAWANYPLPLVTKVLDKFGVIDGMEEITGAGAVPPEMIDITPAAQISPPNDSEEEDTGPPEEGTVLELSEDQPSPFVGRGAVWAAAPRHTMYAYNKLRTMVSGAFKQAISVVIEDAAKYKNEKTIDDLADKVVSDIRKEAASAISTKDITDIFTSTIYKIHTEAKDVAVAREKATKKAEAVPGLPSENWQMNWTLENQEATNYFSKSYSLYLSKYVSQGNAVANNTLRNIIRSDFINTGLTPNDKNAMAYLRAALGDVSTSLESANNTYLKMMVNTAVSRAQNIGSLMAMKQMGVQTYKIVGPSDAKTCSFCLAMMGRVADLNKDYMFWKEQFAATIMPDEDQPTIKEFSMSNRYANNREELFVESTSKLQAGGPVNPPYHPNCRHTIVAQAYNIPTPVEKPVVEPPVDIVTVPSSHAPTPTTSPLASSEQTPLTASGIKEFIDQYQEQYKYLQRNIHTFEKVTHEIRVEESTYSLTGYKDPNTGETWLYKQAGRRGSQAEALAYQLGQLINPGDRVPVFAGDLATRIRQETGTFQKYIPQDRIESYSLSLGTNDSKVKYQQLVKEQVVDQFLGNWDAHKKNFFVGKDGRVIFIDKGQSFKYYHNDYTDSYWSFQAHGKIGSVYERMEALLHRGYDSSSKLFRNTPEPLDVREEIAPVLANVKKLFATQKNKELVAKMINNTISDTTTGTAIFNGMEKRSQQILDRFDSLYKELTGDSTYKVSEKVSGVKKPKTKIVPASPMSAAIAEMVEKIFPDVAVEYKRVFASAYERYAEKPLELLAQNSYFREHNKLMAECLDSWEGSSSANNSVLLKALASKLEGAGDILLNSRRGEQPQGWRGLSHFYRNYIRSGGYRWPEDLAEVEKMYIEARAYAQAYVRKAYPDGMPVLYRGARLKAIRDLLVDPDTPFPVEVREQTIASFSRNKRKADTFGTSGEQREGYVYNVKKLAYEDVVFTDKQLPGGYANEQEILVRSVKGRKITKEQLSIVKNEMIRRMLQCSNEEWQDYLRKKQTPLSASVLDLSRHLLKSYVTSFTKGKA